MNRDSEFSYLLAVESLGEAARRVRLEADAGVREALARRFDLVSMESLVADLVVDRIDGSELIRVKGRVSASITQSCVVTGAPVSVQIEECVDERFGPPGEPVGEIEFSLEEEDPPEDIVDGQIDLGEMVSQYLGVAIDPYPRATGAEIPARYREVFENQAESANNPFEVLSALRSDKD